MTTTKTKQDAARAEAYRLVDQVRAKGFKGDAGDKYTDGQIWQAILDSKEYGGFVYDNAAVCLITHALEGRTPPEAPQLPNRQE